MDDIPSPPRCLHAAYVLSSEPHAKLKGVDANIAMGSPGAAAFISVKDIPDGGKNVGIVSNFMGLETELLFAEDVVGYAGQPLGVMVITFCLISMGSLVQSKVDWDIERSTFMTLELEVTFSY